MKADEYQQLLSEHEWHYHCMPPSDYHTHGWNEVKLIELARQHGHQSIFNHFYFREFKIPFFKDFPVATMANEQHQTDKHMNLTLNITADPAILEALNRIADGFGTRCTPATVTAAPATQEEEETPVKPAPKKAAKKPMETKPVPAEPEEEEFTLTGAELVERLGPLKNSEYSKALRGYMNKDLDLGGVTLGEVTDAAKLKKIDAKITELLKAKAKADAEEEDI